MKNILSLVECDKDFVDKVIAVAMQMRKVVLSNYKKSPHLAGSVLCGVWNRADWRSAAFSLAAAYMSGTSQEVFATDDVMEQLMALDAMGANDVVVSNGDDNLIRAFAQKAKCNVINGGSSSFDPVGVLADLAALSVKTDGLKGISVLVVGNKKVNKMAELTHALGLYNSSVVWCLPPDDVATVRRGIVIDNPSAAFVGADAVIDIGLNAYCNAELYYGHSAGIPQELMKKARVNAPLLGTRNVVSNGAVVEYPGNIVSETHTCYVSVVMALLYLLHRG